MSGEGEFGWEIEGNEGGDGEGELMNSRGTKESMYNRALIKLIDWNWGQGEGDMDTSSKGGGEEGGSLGCG